MLTRECLLQMLATREDRFHVEGAASAAETAIGKADLVLLNIKSTPVDDKSVLAQLTDIRIRFGQVPVVVITDLDEGELAAEAFRNDVRGYIPTSMSGDFVLAAIDLVLAGGVALPEPLLARCIGIPAIERQPVYEEGAAECDDCPYLTSRETDVLARLRKGKPNKIIAYELNISESTVKVHVRNIMKKMRATNRTQVAVLMQSVAAAPHLLPEAIPA
jgi:DNA-binding NarL/FixJ family response regulator